MSYKKLVSLFAVSTLALGACGTDDAEEPEANDTEETEDEEGSSSKDQINQAKDLSGDASLEYGLEVVSGNWTVDGYEVPYAPGEEGTVSVEIDSEQAEYNTYLVEDGEIMDVESNEPEVSFVVTSPAEDSDYLVGVSGEDLGEPGDEVSEDDFYRSENIIFVESEEEEEAEE